VQIEIMANEINQLCWEWCLFLLLVVNDDNCKLQDPCI